jgi:SUF system NifU family Fe-S assembly protein
MRLEQIYQDVILDHYGHPQHRGLRAPFAAQVYHGHPVCGDEVTLRVALSDDGERVVDVSYDGQGYSISQASTSVLTEHARCGLLHDRGARDRRSTQARERTARPLPGRALRARGARAYP